MRTLLAATSIPDSESLSPTFNRWEECRDNWIVVGASRMKWICVKSISCLHHPSDILSNCLVMPPLIMGYLLVGGGVPLDCSPDFLSLKRCICARIAALMDKWWRFLFQNFDCGICYLWTFRGILRLSSCLEMVSDRAPSRIGGRGAIGNGVASAFVEI